MRVHVNWLVSEAVRGGQDVEEIQGTAIHFLFPTNSRHCFLLSVTIIVLYLNDMVIIVTVTMDAS